MSPLPGDVQWFPSEIRKLIVAIKKHEGLYNPRHENFGLRDTQAKIWKQVAAQVGGSKTDTQCRDKWNCLRGTYRRHVRTEVTNTVKRRSGWPWADMMSFMKKHLMERDETLMMEIKRMKSAIVNTPADTTTSSTATTVTTNTTSAASVQQIVTTTNTPALVVTSSPQNKIITTKQIFTTTNGTGGGIKLTGGLYSGGLIINRNNISLVPNQSVGILRSSPGNVQMSLVKPTQTNIGVRLVPTIQARAPLSVLQSKSSQVRSSQAQSAQSSAATSDVQNSETMQVDLSKVKPDPDGPVKTEFVDMDIVVKKEPMEPEELQLNESYNFLAEESSQELIDESSVEESAVEVNETPESTEHSVSTSPRLGQDVSENDSNELFMRSTVTQMRFLSSYDQSVFKMKVQQLLHSMMFPNKSPPSNGSQN